MTPAEFLVRTRALTGFVPLVKQLGGDAAALLKRQGLDDANCSGLDEMDKEELRILRDDYGLASLRGLD